MPPNKFFGLHSHTGFSVFDGLGYPDEHMNFCIENGLDGWAQTDHGHMNGFGHGWQHAQKLKESGKKFKWIPGCEMYLHPDLDEWRSQYARVQAGENIKQEIVTEISRKTDENDETVGVDTDSNLTIENEDETKTLSAKTWNPLNRRHHIVVLPKTSVGLQKLFGLVSRGYRDGFYKFPRIDYKTLREAAQGEHLVISSACLGGALSFQVLHNLQLQKIGDLHPDVFKDASLWNKIKTEIGNEWERMEWAVGQGNAYLELQSNRLPAQHVVNYALLRFAKETGNMNKLVVTCDSHYPRPEQWKEREIYKKLGWLNYTELNPNAIPKSKDQLKCELYPKNAHQVWEEFKIDFSNYSFYKEYEDVISNAIERTHDIAHQQIGEIEPDRKMKLPSYVIPEGKTANSALIEACKFGLQKKGLLNKKEYVERIKMELGVIRDKNFAEYFLTMKAIFDVANEHMLLGPARGSAGGSLVCYVLGITNIDPIKYDLLFERFLSIHRKEEPDVDSDVEDRDLLFTLLREKFGTENVIPISNYNTFKLKTLVRDVSRFYNVPLEEVNAGLKTVEEDVKSAVFDIGTDKNLFVLTYEDSLKHSPPFAEFIDRHPEVAEPIKILFKQNKALGRHAGGVIISENIADRMPLIRSKDGLQSPWPEGMNYKLLSPFGWIKFDLLGLETLRIIRRTIELILIKEGNQNPTFKEIKAWFDSHLDPSILDMDDQKVYKYVYHEGRFPGVFQLANRGAQRLFESAKPTSIIDIATLTATYRPGPLAAKVDKLYLERKAAADKIDYRHPLIKEVLEETFNCIIFQEQIMSLCNKVAGFPKQDCDQVRRNIMKRTAAKAEESKKQVQEMRDQFVSGSVANGISAKVADELYSDILYFCGYGFNKSHSVAYAIDSYWCAWLLTYYEPQWLCAYVESMLGSPEDRAKAISEVREMGWSIGTVDVNLSTDKWVADEQNKMLIPSFSSVKGVGATAIEEILQMRPYKTIEDLLWDESGEWKHSKFNKRALDALIKVKAFGSMNVVGPGKTFSSWKQMHHILIECNDQIKKRTKKEPNKGKNKFNELLLETEHIGEWSRKETAEFQGELFGSVDVGSIVTPQLSEKFKEKDIRPLNEWTQADVYWAIVTDVQKKTTKNGKQYLLIQLMNADGGKEKIFMWEWDGKLMPEPYQVIIAEIDKNNYGCSTKQRKAKFI